MSQGPSGALARTRSASPAYCHSSAYPRAPERRYWADRKSTRLNSSHVSTSYAVFCLKKKNTIRRPAIGALTATALIVSMVSSPATAREPDAISEFAQHVIDAIVNISTSHHINSQLAP